MISKIYLGPCPSDETSLQIIDGVDQDLVRYEVEIWRDQIRRTFKIQNVGEVKRGSYFEACFVFDHDQRETMNECCRVAAILPKKWDHIALEKLKNVSGFFRQRARAKSILQRFKKGLAGLFFALILQGAANAACPPKPAPPAGIPSSAGQCVQPAKGPAHWVFIVKPGARCGVKPRPPVGKKSSDAFCECTPRKTCRWIFKN